MAEKFDFCGYATKNDIKCTDGRTIRRNAFVKNNGKTVPLVWMHNHKDPENVLGHALLENRDDGVYCYCSFNDSEKAQIAKELVKHGDLKSLSIFANQLKQNGGDVLHGDIKEVSLVLSGANSGALIEECFAHGEGSYPDEMQCLNEDMELMHGEELEHGCCGKKKKNLEHKKCGGFSDCLKVTKVYLDELPDELNEDQQDKLDLLLQDAAVAGYDEAKSEAEWEQMKKRAVSELDMVVDLDDYLEDAMKHNDSADEFLMHKGGFKYLDKWWKNGRWNYQYDEPKGNNSSGNGSGNSGTSLPRKGIYENEASGDVSDRSISTVGTEKKEGSNQFTSTAERKLANIADQMADSLTNVISKAKRLTESGFSGSEVKKMLAGELNDLREKAEALNTARKDTKESGIDRKLSNRIIDVDMVKLMEAALNDNGNNVGGALEKIIGEKVDLLKDSLVKAKEKSFSAISEKIESGRDNLFGRANRNTTEKYESEASGSATGKHPEKAAKVKSDEEKAWDSYAEEIERQNSPEAKAARRAETQFTLPDVYGTLPAPTQRALDKSFDKIMSIYNDCLDTASTHKHLTDIKKDSPEAKALTKLANQMRAYYTNVKNVIDTEKGKQEVERSFYDDLDNMSGIVSVDFGTVINLKDYLTHADTCWSESWLSDCILQYKVAEADLSNLSSLVHSDMSEEEHDEAITLLQRTADAAAEMLVADIVHNEIQNDRAYLEHGMHTLSEHVSDLLGVTIELPLYLSHGMANDDFLMHYGRKGMKWGKNIFEQDYMPVATKPKLPDEPEQESWTGGSDRADVINKKISDITGGITRGISNAGKQLDAAGNRIRDTKERVREGKENQRLVETQMVEDRNARINSAIDKTVTGTKNAANAVKGGVKKAAGAVKSAAIDTKNAVEEAKNNYLDAQRNYQAVEAQLRQAELDNMNKAVDSVKSGVTNTVNTIKNKLAEAKKNMEDAQRNYQNVQMELNQRQVDKVNNTIDTAKANVEDTKKKATDTTSAISDTLKKVKENWENMTEANKETASELLKQLKGILTHSDYDEEEVMNYLDALEHASGNEDLTVGDVWNTFSEDQKSVVYYLLSQMKKAEDANMKHSEEDDNMKRNIFDQNTTSNDSYLAHAEELNDILEEAKSTNRSLKATYLAHASDYGIENVSYLFPDDHNLTPTPTFIKRKTEWVSKVMGAVNHTPFSRVKTIFADITEADARAKGYITANRKTEEVFMLLKRSTEPTTVYKKQKMDRDVLTDISTFNAVPWIKSEMRVMLDEELARAYLVGDGRSVSSEDKINEQNIRPIWKDDSLFVIHKTLNMAASATEADKAKAFITAAIKARKDYRGSGMPTLFTTEDLLTDMLLLVDGIGHDLYPSVEKLCTKLRVKEIVTVPVMENLSRIVGTSTMDLMGIIVNLADYTVGADKGGEINMFDDFDIDFNQQKFLMETRCSAALTVPYSAIVIESSSSMFLETAPVEPTVDVLGKYASALQSNVLVNDDSITGTLKYVTGYTGYSGDPAEQSGNYLALKFDYPAGTTATVNLLNSGHAPVTLDSDKMAVFRVDNRNQKIKVVAVKDGLTEQKIYSLRLLKMESAT